MDEYKYLNGSLIFNFRGLVVELSNDPSYRISSGDNNFTYHFIYVDKEAGVYLGSNHGVKILSAGKVIKSAIVCGVGGGTTIHSHSAVIIDNAIFICCANKVFSLSLPDLKLNWLTQVDMATCFGIYKADGGLFTHGELSVARIDIKGQIIWETGLRDIIVNIDKDNSRNEFLMCESYIDLLDFNGNTYQLGFDGKFIAQQISELQKRSDLIQQRVSRKIKPWWRFWVR